MISAYTSELVRTLYKSELFSKEELQGLLDMPYDQFEALLNGSDNAIELTHIENLTNAFGMQVFGPEFMGNIFGSGNAHHEGHYNVAAKNEELRLKMDKLNAFFGGRKNTIISKLARLSSIQEYIESAELMLDAVKEAESAEIQEEANA